MEASSLSTRDDAVFVLDEAGAIRCANRPAGRLLSAPVHELVGRCAEAVFDSCEWIGELTGAQDLRTASGRISLRRADGSSISLAATATVLPADGPGCRVVLTVSTSPRSTVEQKLAHRALHDPLTGLANRALFGARLAMALAEAEAHPGSVAVLLMDIDRFKSINDVLGHKSGDELIRLFGGRLKGVVGPRSVVARLGGDEFAILCPLVRERDDALRIADRIVETMKAPFDLLGERVVVSTSVGVAFASGSDTRADDVVRDADSAMYRAKRQGRGRFEAFDEAAREHSLGRRAIETALRQALERSEFGLALEPVVSLATDEVVDVEALLRWHSDDLGPVPVADFLEVAEESGLIVAMEREVLRSACRQASEWLNAAGPDAEGPGVSVNLSHRHVLLPRFLRSVVDTLEATGLPPAKLSLEIPDSVFVADDPATRVAFEELARLGVRVVLNDFGRGRCALREIARWPLHAVKLDAELVEAAARTPRERRILGAVVEMARAMELKVVAKGVETSSQLDVVSEVGCDAAQGRLFAGRLSGPLELAHPSEVTR